MKLISRAVLVAGVAFASLASRADAQTWTNWTGYDGDAGSVFGTLGLFNLSVTGGFSGYQLSNGIMSNTFVPNYGANRVDYNWWNSAVNTPSAAYTQGGLTPPPPMGLIQFVNAGTITIDFGGAVTNPLIAINSLGNPSDNGLTTMTFGGQGTSASLISSNNGGISTYWGTGTCNLVENVLTGAECSGVVQLNGTFTSLSISGTTENWYGITVGEASVVPEPSTYALMAFGLAGLGFVARRKRAAQAA